MVTSPPGGRLFDVFVSYHSGDADWVATLKAALESRGLSVWVDTEQLRPGDLFPGALARAIGAVRCVVIVLSRGSIASTWVEEEYSLALANQSRVIAALIDDVEPPGFLAGRTWVDFRDESQFASSLAQLTFGITGKAAPQPLTLATPGYRDDGVAPDATDEAAVLERLIERRRHEAARLWRARMLSGMVGLALGAVFFVVAAEASLSTRSVVGLLAPTILSLAAWGVTATSLTRLDNRVEQFEVLRDGLEACRSRSLPGCRKLRQHFWEMMVHLAVDAKAPPV